MDTNHQPEEILESLPKFEKFHDYSWENDSYWGKGLPWQRLKRWVESQEGEHIDNVIHKFVNLKWLLQEYRTMHQLRRQIEMDTFLEDGKVMYYSEYPMCGVAARPIEGGTKEVYVHPKTRCIQVYRPPTRESWRKQHQKELDAKLRILGDYHQLYKLNGIWYEVKAEPAKDQNKWNRLYKTYGLTNGMERKGPKDILLEKNSAWKRASNDPFVMVILKRQINGKELKKHGLQNNS